MAEIFMGNDFDDFDKPSATSSRAELGDIIEFQRTGYMHYAVYIGNGMTIGVGGPNKKKRSKIVEESLSSLCQGGRFKCRVNNLEYFAKICGVHPPYDEQTIVARALKKKGDEIIYNLASNNCEVFATHCRYGGKGFTVQGSVPEIVPLRWVKNVTVRAATPAVLVAGDISKLGLDIPDKIMEFKKDITTSLGRLWSV